MCQGYPRRPGPTAGAVGEGRHSVGYLHLHLPNPRAPRSPKRVGKGFGLLTATGEWRSARRGAQLPSGDPRVHHGATCGQVEAFPPRTLCPGGGVLLPREIQRSGQSGNLRAEERPPRLGTRPAGWWGLPWARQAAAAPGKVLLAVQGMAPRAGIAQVQLGRASANGPGAKRGPSGRQGGAPSGRGLCRGWRVERRWSNGEVRRGPHRNLRYAGAGPPRRRGPWPGSLYRFPGETWRLALGRQAQRGSDPGFPCSQSHALRGTGCVQDWRAQ